MKLIVGTLLFLVVLATGVAVSKPVYGPSFWTSLGFRRGPVQPIAYSHKLHAGKLQMNCLYCHYAAEKSQSVNIPAPGICMGCHRVTAVDRPEIQKLTRYYDSGQTPPWVEVYRLPDHVKFNHKRHVKANIECQTCHGPVQEMDVMYQYPSLKMGWCLKCHRERLDDAKNPAPMDCIACHH